MNSVAVVVSERLARYGFGDGHPFGPDRLAAFVREFSARGLPQRVLLLEPRDATEEELATFHTPDYLEFVRERSASGTGLLDAGDTPAFRGVYEAARGVVGATLSCMEAMMQGKVRRAFVPIAGLHELDVDELRASFESAALAEAEIYPEIWTEPDVFDSYLAPNLTALRAFYVGAAAENQALPPVKAAAEHDVTVIVILRLQPRPRPLRR